MFRILRIGLAAEGDLEAADRVEGWYYFRVACVKTVEGPEITQPRAFLYELRIPCGWQELREKELAALRRTVAAAAMEVAREVGPQWVYVTDASLCGVAGVLARNSLHARLALCLTAEEIEEGLFNERLVAILDSSIREADLILVTSASAARLLEGYYSSLSHRIIPAAPEMLDDKAILAILRDRTHARFAAPWKRLEPQSLLISRPCASGAELSYIEEVLRSGWWGYGPVCHHLEEQIAQWCGGGTHALAVNNCTAALHLALLAAGVGPGDEVLVPALTFASTAAAVLHVGATPRFCDVDRRTLMICPQAIEEQITTRTKAIIPVHFAGIPADLEGIESAVGRRDLVIIEDAAHALGAERNGWRVGSRSPFTCFSFAPTKTVASAGGGLLTFRDRKLARLLRELSDVGLRVDTYERTVRSHVPPVNEILRLGYRYRMNDISAAIAVAQWEGLERKLAHREALVAHYREQFSYLDKVEVLAVPGGSKPSWYIFPVRVPAGVRNDLRHRLAAAGIDTSVHYPSLTVQPAFQGMPGRAPRAEEESRRLITLPLHEGISLSDVDRVCGEFHRYFGFSGGV